MAIYSQLSLAKKTVKMAIYSQLSKAKKKKNVKMAIYIQNGYYLSYNTGKSYFVIYHVGSVRHYFLGHFGIFCFSWLAFLKM